MADLTTLKGLLSSNMPATYDDGSGTQTSCKDNLACVLVNKTLIVTTHTKDFDEIPSDDKYKKNTVFVGQVVGFNNFLNAINGIAEVDTVVWGGDFNATFQQTADNVVTFGEKNDDEAAPKKTQYAKTFDWFVKVVRSPFKSVMKYRIWTAMLSKMALVTNNIDGFLVFTRAKLATDIPVILREATENMETVQDVNQTPPSTTVTDHRAVSCIVNDIQITTINAGVGASGAINNNEFAKGKKEDTDAIVKGIKQNFIDEVKRYIDLYGDSFYNTLPGVGEANKDKFKKDLETLLTTPNFTKATWYTDVLMAKFEYNDKTLNNSVFNDHPFIENNTFEWEKYAKQDSIELDYDKIALLDDSTFKRNMSEIKRKKAPMFMPDKDNLPFIFHPLQFALLHAWNKSYKDNVAFYSAMAVQPATKLSRLNNLFNKALNEKVFPNATHHVACYQEVTYGPPENKTEYEKFFMGGKLSDLRPADEEHGVIMVKDDVVKDASVEPPPGGGKRRRKTMRKKRNKTNKSNSGKKRSRSNKRKPKTMKV